MRYYRFFTILIGLTFIFTLNSCVSSRKYKEMTAQYQSNEQAKIQCYSELNALRTEYNAIRKAKDSIMSVSSETIYEKQKLLDQKEKELLDREKRIKQLTTIINQQSMVVSNLKSKVAEALVGYAADELTVELRDGKVYVSLSDKLLFPSGSDKVNAKGTEAIKKLANALAYSDSTITIFIEGHTDTIPINTAKFGDNWDLSVHRATSIIRILTDNGVSPQQVIASGRGEYYPIASNLDAEGRQKNRRTEIILSPKLDELWSLLEGN